MNPMLQLLKNGANPQQLALSMLNQQAQSNPILQNLLSLAQNGDAAGVEQMARNIVEGQGKDFDTEFSKFRNSIGL